MPGVFGVRIFTTYNTPNINIDLMEATGVEEVSDRSFDRLLNAKYFHSAIIVQCNGFKITSSGFSIDMNLQFMLYEQMTPLPKRRISLPSFKRRAPSNQEEENEDLA